MVNYDQLRSNSTRPHVVIVGGGFGGLYAARALAGASVDVSVIDRHNYHLFQPLLYQVATAALAAPDIAAPIRKILKRQANARVLLGAVIGVDPVTSRVLLEDGALSYDYLVLAAGVEDSYFGHAEWRAHAPGLKSIGDAFEIRRKLLLSFEEAEREPDSAKRREHLTFVIVGAGPTGVELAGSVAEIARHTLARNFRNFDPAEARIILIEGQSRVLPGFPQQLSTKAASQLERLGVTLWTSTLVSQIDALGIRIGDERIVARTVVWAAGVRASSLLESLGAPLDRSGRVLVEPDLSVPGYPRIQVIGDAAAVRQGSGFVPGVAPAAIQMGRLAARNLMRRINGTPTEEFSYVNRGTLATIGRRAAVADFGRFQFSGLSAWLLWLFVHILFLIGFRSRVAVLFEWAVAYLTYQRSARVILSEPRLTSPTEPSGPPPAQRPPDH